MNWVANEGELIKEGAFENKFDCAKKFVHYRWYSFQFIALPE